MRSPVQVGLGALRLCATGLLFALGIIFLGGCDAGGFDPDELEGQPPPRSPNSPRLDSITPREFCVGQEVILEGVNFQNVLEQNVVTFNGIPGLPTRVEFPSNGNAQDGLESRLRVIVPTGVQDGNVELTVAGISAGLRDYSACPQIISFGIGQSGLEPRITHSGILGFFPQNPPINIIVFGLNFENVTQVVVGDRQGTQVQIPRNRFISRAIPNLKPNRLQAIEFNLEGVNLSIQQGAAGQRDNISVMLSSDARRSNRIQVPVANFQATSPAIGAVINGVIVPPGVRTGPVKIFYSMYDHPLIDQAFSMDVAWSVDGGQNYFPAEPVPESVEPDNITRQLLPGDVDMPSEADLVFGGGQLHSFTWDAQNDANFRALNGQGAGAARSFTINFRLHPIPEGAVQGGINAKPPDSGHLVESAPVAYFDLEDRGAVSFAGQREGELFEDFSTNQNVDASCNTSRWGPPGNPGELRGTIPPNPPPQTGLGTFDLALVKSPPPVATQFYIVNTTSMSIVHVVDDGAGNTDTQQVFPTLQETNPGDNPTDPTKPQGEFHVRTLFIESGLDVRLDGNRPVIFRVSGANLNETDVSVQIDGNVLANGDPGEDGPDPGDGTPGDGGLGHCGGGNGGRGAELLLDPAGGIPQSNPPSFVRAGDGGNDGGLGGRTTAAIDALSTNLSRFLGAPGGGGGNRLRGEDGDPGAPRNPSTYTSLRGGKGGPKRGSPHLVPLSPGSGGGGGGATINRPANATPPVGAPVNGAGGGGGGGGIQITAHGSVVVKGTISANGGKGGNGNNSGAGGGGSGGCILVQSDGLVDATCESLQANGGENGITQNQNVKPGAGDGAPGWIRVEPRLLGGPFCGILALQTQLSARLDTSQAVSKVINVLDASRFPTKGVVVIDQEVIAYGDVDRAQNLLKLLTRGLRGTTIANHEGPPNAARVILETPVSPPESLVKTGGDINLSPDVIAGGSALDGVFHAFFIETLDPDTGDPIVDPATGEKISVWNIDTDTGAIITPTGSVALVSSASTTDPGLFSFSRFRIDSNVVVRATGSRPLRIQVSETAEIAGTLDLSGFDGEPIQFDANAPATPAPGGGGRGGPGGGAGGDGGTIVFLDGNVDNKDPANVSVVPALPGGLPVNFPAEFDRTGSTSGSIPPPNDLVGLEATRATAGEPLRSVPACGLGCTSGGGGGAGNRTAGADGLSRPAGSVAFGRGGSEIGLDSFRFGGGLFLLGGGGGAGGGASSDVSEEYRTGNAGNSVFRGAAHFAPGTGGGGGGGVLELDAQGAFHLRSTGAILARGGDAIQSIDLGGNGGAGAGGSVFIRLANSLTMEPGARIDVAGGVANLPPPTAGGLPLYEPNIRLVGTEMRPFGGNGGNGGLGRVRIEAPRGSNLLRSSFNDSVSSGVLLLDVTLSTACSKVLPLGVGPGGMAASHFFLPSGAIMRFADQGLADGTDAILLWKGAAPSLDVHGVPGPLRGGVEDPRDLEDLDYVQFAIQILSNAVSRETPTIREVRLPFRLGEVP